MSEILALPQTTRPYERCELNRMKYRDLNVDVLQKFLTLYNSPAARLNFLDS